jgi:spermidine synthase
MLDTLRLSRLLPALFLAGAASIAEEVAWSRALLRVLGSTTGAAAAVLAGILGGMALGSWLAGRVVDRTPGLAEAGALRHWAVASFAAGAAAILLTTALAMIERADRVPARVDVLLVLLIALAAAPVGAGFPFAVASLGADPSPRRIGWIYGIGAVGGSLGALLVPLFSIPAIGERWTLILAASLQIAAGAAVAALRNFPRSVPVPVPVPVPDFSRSTVNRQLSTLLVFLSGLTVIYWEVLWTRILVLVVGSSVYPFAVAAGSVVLGIGVGSILFTGRGGDRGRWLLPLGVLALLSVAYFLVPRLPDAYLTGIRAFPGSALAVEAGGAGLVVLLACAPLGVVLPWALARSPARAGALQAANGVGSALGALLGGPVLAGRIGLQASFIAGLAAVGSLAVAGAACGRRSTGRLAILAAIAIAVPSALGSSTGRTGWDLKRLLSGVYQWPLEDLLARDPAGDGRRLLAVAEGRQAIVSVERDENTVYVKASGKVEGSVPADPSRPSLADLPTQLLLGALPGLLDRGDSLAVVGLGSGTTLGAAHRAARGAIDLIEIEPEFAGVIGSPDVRPYLAPFLGGALESRRVTAWYGDARSLLAGELSGKKWQAIASQPSEPWIAASASLFTREFFERASRRLTEGGIFCQWVQLYKLELPALELVVRTFRATFDRVFVMRPPATGELILIGARGPLDPGGLLESAARLRSAAPGLLEAMGFSRAEDLLAAFLLGPEGVDAWVDPGRGLPLNTDDRNEVLVLLPPSLHAGKELARSNLRAIQERGGTDPISRYLKPALRSPERLRVLASRNIFLGDFWEARAMIEGDPSPEAETLRKEADREIAASGTGTGTGIQR